MNGSKFSGFAIGFLVAAIVAGTAGYFIGNKSGYAKAQADVKAQQDAVAKKAGDEAAKAANPFQATNPLEGVTANPFEKAKSALNPFSQ